MRGQGQVQGREVAFRGEGCGSLYGMCLGRACSIRNLRGVDVNNGVCNKAATQGVGIEAGVGGGAREGGVWEG